MTSTTIDPPAGTIRQVTQSDVPALARAMASAFYDDPVAGHWCFADESRRRIRLERGFELVLRRVYLVHGGCYAAEGMRGGALWLPPGEWRLGMLDQLRLLPRMAHIYGGALARVLRVMGFLEARHPHEPHWYLGFLGVARDSQAQGIGSALLEHELDGIDRDGMPAYLEASSERNRALYERHGFEVLEAVTLPGGGPPMWRMWREAGR
jgi:ribosomal protein S18 acetylase RimI-like enzyme